MIFPATPDEEPLGVFDAVADAVEMGGGAEFKEGFEEGRGEGEGVGCRSHNNHKTAGLTNTNARGNPLLMAINPLWWRTLAQQAASRCGEVGTAGYGG